MALLTYRNLTVSFGGPKLLDNASLMIEEKERLCLVGRNGEGKSTLLRILDGVVAPDHGELETKPGICIRKLDQEIPTIPGETVFEVVAAGLGEASRTIAEYHRVARDYALDSSDEELADRLDELQNQLDHSDGWEIDRKVETVLDRVGLDGDMAFEALSGGNKRRALLARALVAEPDLLLLDEPTNHLDIPGIRWLEEFFRKTPIALLFVSHDRSFVRRMADGILDLDRGRLSRWDCNYDTYLERKSEWLAGEAKRNENFDKKLSEEEVWIRKGIRARRTRNEGRVRALQEMRQKRAQRREQSGAAQLEMNDAQMSGRKVIEAKGIGFDWDGSPLIQDFTTTIWRGDKIGICGLNGSGKTTLLQLLLGKLTPQEGTVTHGTRLEVAYFDQHRAQLDPNLSVAENVFPGGDTVTINGRSRHILSYLQDFLFTAETARAPIRKLSGGERARLLLARLFLQPANLLVLDEPTNDLDIETVELLEERLLEFDATLLLVSHDRAFLDNVVTSTLALEGDGQVREYAAGADQWVADFERRQAASAAKSTKPTVKTEAKIPPKDTSKAKPRKLLNKEREALKSLPGQIETLEAEHSELAARMSTADYYQDPKNDPAADSERLAKLEEETLEAYARWEELSELEAGAR
ncbi:ATP-binding cassette domain-containing protein [Puniceicoccus vermicola]|uniref:ATP-binding protein Uup n=1 Tax=Puniceicoccus vermicola TaxID=388746 RepID=A0A7X1E6G3_9BACT|nr:ATP-binding cassette domain-containing protein [Puniceicoccus vermicola]MBC2604219.1 ATP-binding cassette domain-containing protein [Puniceicoccus vermicola]